jgi:pyruvate decarboxylase
MRHSYFWPLLQNFILEGDIIATESGTAIFGALDMRLPTGACIIAQYFCCTIGFEAAASCGGTVAAHRATSSSNGLAQ